MMFESSLESRTMEVEVVVGNMFWVVVETRELVLMAYE